MHAQVRFPGGRASWKERKRKAGWERPLGKGLTLPVWRSACSLFLLPRVQEEAEEQEEQQEKKVLGNSKVQGRMRNIGEGTRWAGDWHGLRVL